MKKKKLKEVYIDPEGEILLKDKYFGQVVGIYKIWGRRFLKSNDRHALYKGECIHCGTVMNRIMVRSAKNFKKCHHLNKNWHGTETRLRSIYDGMVARCYDTKDKSYRWYGAKGIKICNDWLNDHMKFVEWALNNGYESNLSIERIDEDKDYCPENCTWISLSENAKYKTTTNYIIVNGECHSGRDWSEILGLGPNTINTIKRDYGEKIVINFIEARLKKPSLTRISNQKWLDVYEIDYEKEEV